MSNIIEHNEWLNCYWPLKRLEKDQVSSCSPFRPILLLPQSSVGPNVHSLPKGTFWWMSLVIYLDSFSFLWGLSLPFLQRKFHPEIPILRVKTVGRGWFPACYGGIKVQGMRKRHKWRQFLAAQHSSPRMAGEDWASAFWLSDANLSKC